MDGDLRAQLRGHLAALQPVELVVPAGGLTATTWKVPIVALCNNVEKELPSLPTIGGI